MFSLKCFFKKVFSIKVAKSEIVVGGVWGCYEVPRLHVNSQEEGVN
jgi:hypothetical protein